MLIQNLSDWPSAAYGAVLSNSDSPGLNGTSLRRFHGTAVRKESTLKTAATAMGNSEAVAERHYVKPEEVLPDVRKAVNDAVSGLTDVQPLCIKRVN